MSSAEKQPMSPLLGNILAEWSRIDVVAGDVMWAPDLAGNVARLEGPVLRWHGRELAVEEDETALDVSVLVLSGGGPGAAELADSHAGLGPVGEGGLVSRIVGDQLEVDLVIVAGDHVLHGDTVRESAHQFDPGLFLVRRNKFGLVADDRVVPVAIGGAGTAVCFQVMGLHHLAGKVAVNVQHVLLPRAGQLGSGLGERRPKGKDHEKRGQARGHDSILTRSWQPVDHLLRAF